VSGFALRNFVDIDRFFRECGRVLRPGGRVATLETAEPASPILRAGHHVWFRRVVPFVGATLARDAEAYQYLPRSTAYLPAPGDLLALVEAAGIEVDGPVARAGTGAIAVSALPFRGAAAGELMIPAFVTGVDADGRAWRTEIGSTSPSPTSATTPPTQFSVEGRVSRAEWASQ